MTTSATPTTGTAGSDGPEGEAAGEPATEAAARSRLRPLLPARLRRAGRPHLLLELAFSVALYLAYSRTRRYVPRHKTEALHRAREVLHAERLLHVNVELSINHAVNSVDWLVVGMNYYYATLHFIVTPAVLVWVYARRPAYYRGVRTALYWATVLALFGFTFFALAPPRFLADQGFIDTIVTHHTWGSWDSGHVSTVSNQYAAMPSVHIVWSAWCGLTLAFLARRTWVKVLGICYPLATFTVILATANHFLADAVAGAVTLALGFGIQRLLSAHPAYRPREAVPGRGTPPSTPAGRREGGARRPARLPRRGPDAA